MLKYASDCRTRVKMELEWLKKNHRRSCHDEAGRSGKGVGDDVRCPAMRTSGSLALDVLLSARGRGRLYSGAHAENRRGVHEAAVLRSAADDGPRSLSQTGAAADAGDGARGDLSEAETVGQWARS